MQTLTVVLRLSCSSFFQNRNEASMKASCNAWIRKTKQLNSIRILFLACFERHFKFDIYPFQSIIESPVHPFCEKTSLSKLSPISKLKRTILIISKVFFVSVNLILVYLHVLYIKDNRFAMVSFTLWYSPCCIVQKFARNASVSSLCKLFH